MAAIPQVSVPLGTTVDVFGKHDVAESNAIVLINFLTKIWLTNPISDHERLIKSSLEMLDLDDLVEQMLIVEVLPLLTETGKHVFTATLDGAINTFSVNKHTILLEYS